MAGMFCAYHRNSDTPKEDTADEDDILHLADEFCHIHDQRQPRHLGDLPYAALAHKASGSHRPSRRSASRPPMPSHLGGSSERML